MSDGALSQDEIDALLQGAEELTPEPAAAAVSAPAAGMTGLSDSERSIILDTAKLVVSSASSTLSTITSKTIDIKNPAINIKKQDEIRGEYKGQYVQIRLDYNEGIIGENLYILKLNDAALIADLMMNQDGSSPPTELNDLYLSAVSEAISQMNGGALTALTNKFGKTIKVSPPQIEVVSDSSKLLLPSSDDVIEIKSDMEIEDLAKSTFVQMIAMPLAKELVSLTVGETEQPTFTRQAEVQMPVQPEMAAQPQVAPAVEQIDISKAQFPSLSSDNISQEQQTNLSLLMDVPMQLTVELGRTRMLIKEILGLGEGSIIELDKLAGEPVDLLVNNKLIAKGEVVVIDENFGVRVTDIISPLERINNLQ